MTNIEEIQTREWRTGKKVPYTIYIGDDFVGSVRHSEVADFIVESINEVIALRAENSRLIAERDANTAVNHNAVMGKPFGPSAQEYFEARGQISGNVSHESYMDLAESYADFIVEFEKKGGDIKLCERWPMSRAGKFPDY